MVDAKKEENIKKDALNPHNSSHLRALRKLAIRLEGADDEAGMLVKFKELEGFYYAGKRWMETAKLFGGTGVVLIFVIVGKFPNT